MGSFHLLFKLGQIYIYNEERSGGLNEFNTPEMIAKFHDMVLNKLPEIENA